jgi:hypothetical protein
MSFPFEDLPQESQRRRPLLPSAAGYREEVRAVRVAGDYRRSPRVLVQFGKLLRESPVTAKS